MDQYIVEGSHHC